MTEESKEIQNMESFSDRLDKCKRFQRLTNWVSGGLVVLAVLMTKDIVQQALFKKLAITGIIVGGVLVGHVRQKVDWHETQLQRELTKGTKLSKDSELPDSYKNCLNQTLRFWIWALIFTCLTGLAFLFGIWWAELGKVYRMIIPLFCR